LAPKWPSLALRAIEGAKKVSRARFSLSTPSIGPRYGFPLLKIILSRNIYRMGTLIVTNTFPNCLVIVIL